MRKFFLFYFIFYLIIKLSICEDKYFIKINDKEFLFEFKDTETANQIKSKLPFTIMMTNLNGNEVYHEFNSDFKTNEKSVNNINTGDIYLYKSDCLVLFYKSFSTSYKYTEVGKLIDPTGLEDIIGTKDVKVYWCLNDCTEEININSFVKANLYFIFILLMLL